MQMEKTLDKRPNLLSELLRRFKGLIIQTFSRSSTADIKEESKGIKWYSGTWNIKGCPNCPCSIEYVSFSGAYDSDSDKWQRVTTEDVCPSCGTHLKEACFASSPGKTVLQVMEPHNREDKST